ncbi:MAG: (Fe-S)-binding protein [Bacteroidota bacterium]
MAEIATSKQTAFQGVDIPSYEVLVNCMHCGLCLPQCPTFALTGMEKSSPRGRIRLIKAVADGDLPITQGFIDEMDFCLDCQACETACPAGVKYGSLVEAARSQIHELGYDSVTSKFFKKVFLDWVFRKQARLKFLARGLRMYEKLGIKWFLERAGLLRLFSPKLHNLQPLTPSISAEFSSDTLLEVIKPVGEMKYRVGFLTGCIMDVAYADVNADTVALLLHHGCEVVIPKGQACCGSLQAHNGAMEAARAMARNNIDIFKKENLDYIIMNSAGCGAFMKEYGHVFEHDKVISAEARLISSKIKDITEFLYEIGFRIKKQQDPNHVPAYAGKRVSYHDACHLVHTQKISLQPRELLRSIPAIEYLELPESTWCCGSAGIYNIVRYDDSMKLLDRKVENVKRIMPDIIVAGNPGCLVQMQHGMAKHGLHVEVMHTATFLRRACGA